MNERNDHDLLALRSEARKLRYEPDDPTAYSRIVSGVLRRLEEPASLPEVIAAWFRPLTAALVAASVIAIASLAVVYEKSWVELTANSDIVSVLEDFYGSAE
jgi:hypothetical protein